MDNKSDIALVDAHSEGDSCDNDLDFVVHPVSLNLLASGIGQLRMIEVALDPIVSLQVFGKFFTVFSRDAVDNSAFPFEP